ncbi:MAG: hypothetical protein JNK82_05845 [Myxococcaceae bacterium]|nr:hypothetical protein [Myxococcaceae bacterium]
MRQFMLAVHSVKGQPVPSPEQMKQMYADVGAFNEKVKHLMIFGGGLVEAHRAKVVRNESGKSRVTDGPFVEAKEMIGGFWVLKAENLEAALELAKEASAACQGPVEVREFQEPAPE